MGISLDPVRNEIARLARGRRRVRFTTVLVRLAFYGLAGVAILAWLATWQVVVWAFCSVVGLSVLIAAAAAALVPIDPVVVAKRYDDRVGTKDLVSSSLELDEPSAGENDFVSAVREEALGATGRATAAEIYPNRAPRELRWLPLPVVAAALALWIPILTARSPKRPSAAERQALSTGAARLESLANRERQDPFQPLDQLRLRALESLAERLRDPATDKRKALAELARLASQLDKERQERMAQKLRLEKNTAKLARGEDLADARRDMDAGRYREAANRVKKKIAALQKKLEEAKKNKQGPLEIDKLRKKLARMKMLLAELEQLFALGRDMGFLVEVLEALDRIEGALGELGEFDGDSFDQAQLAPLRRLRKAQNLPKGAKFLLMPSNEAGKGHRTKVLGAGRRSLTEREEAEQRLREGKGKSSFGQVKTANDGSRSRLAYGKAYLSGKRAAEDAIYRQNIPAGYRQYIRQYFETMQPDEHQKRAAGK